MFNIASNAVHGVSTHATVDDACARVVAVFQSDSHALNTPALLSRLREDLVSSMLNALCDYRITLRISRLSLLRALWSSSALRTPITLAFARAKCLPNSSSHASNHRPLSTSEEHNTALLLDELSYLMAVDARNTANPVDQRLRALSTRATDLTRLLHESPSSSHNAVRLLVTCARAIAQIGSPASNSVYQRLVSHVLLYLRTYQSHIHISQLSAVLHAELSFVPSQHLLLESILERYISQPLPPTTINPLLRALLSYISTRSRSDHGVDKFIWFILYILRNPQEDVLTDAIAILELYLHDFLHTLLPRFVRVFNSLVRPNQPALQNGGLSLRVTSAHITILFSVLNISRDEVVRTGLTSSLDAIFTSDISFDTSLLPSSASAGPPSAYATRKTIIANCLRHPAVHVRSDVVLQYLKSLMWRPEHSITVVLDTFFEAFASIPSCRPSFLQTMFSTLVDKYTPVCVLDAYASIFENLANSHHFAFAFAECKDILSEGLQQLAYVPPVIATRVISCFVRVSVAISSLIDPVLVFLRKLAASRAHTHQRVACAGFISIVAHDRVTPDAITEACDNLAILIDVARMSVRTSVIVRLFRFISLNNSFFSRISPLIQHAVSQLSVTDEFVLDKKSVPSENGDVIKPQLSLISFFEKREGEFALKAPVSHLLRLCASARSQCSDAADILKVYEQYLGDWGGALLDAVSSAKSDVPVAARVTLLCSLLQVICLSPGEDEQRSGYSVNVTESHLKIYGVALVVRDSLKTKGGIGKIVASINGTFELPHPDEMTAREGVASRVESDRFEDTGSDDLIPPQTRLRALESMGKSGERGLFVQTVQSEFLDGICSAIENTSNDFLAEKEMEQSTDGWCKPLQECICSAFVHSSPWKHEWGNNDRLQTESSNASKWDARTSSVSTVATINESQSSSASADKQRTPNQCHSDDIHIINGLKLQNEEMSKVLCMNRLPRLESAARTSLRESCLKISHLLISKRLVRDTWSFVRKLCEDCLSRSGSCMDQQPVTSAGERDTSLPVEEDDCVGAVQAITKLFQQEFSSSMTVYLTSLYIGLMDVLLEQLAEDGRNNDVVKNKVSTTILGILREFSVQHVVLMRQMVKVLLRALSLDESIAFGVDLLEWLGNHAALVDSRYCCVDDVRGNRLGLGEFDRDIFEEAVRLDQSDESAEDNDVETVNNAVIDKQNISETGEESGNQCLWERTEETDGSKNIIQSLCLNETADGAVTSICCVFSLFSDVLPQAAKCIKGSYMQPDFDIDSELSRVGKITDGLSAFVKGHFVDGCVGECDSTETFVVNSSIPKPSLSRPKRKRRVLSWPSDLEKKFGSVVFALMDLVDIELQILAKELGAESNWDFRRMTSIAMSCTRILRVLYEETNTLAAIECMHEELSMRWSIQERVEYAATLFAKRWNAWDKKGEVAVSKNKLKNRRQRVVKGRCDSDAHDDVKALVLLVNKLFLDEDDRNGSKSKKQRTGWWALHQEREKAGTSRDDTDFDIGDGNAGASFMRVNKRHRIRSRNNYIDKLMLEDREQESFADLEDFVVEMGDEVT